jgi:hypothetical protein
MMPDGLAAYALTRPLLIVQAPIVSAKWIKARFAGLDAFERHTAKLSNTCAAVVKARTTSVFVMKS